MPLNAILFGVGLISVGLAGYFGSDERSVTALIPAGVGTLLLLLGLIATQHAARKHAIHGAAMVALLGLLAAGGRLGMLLVKQAGSTFGLTCLGLMAALCGLFLVLCIRSFVQARRDRERTAVVS